MTLTELKELRDRVRGLKGADREVDARLARLAGWTYELNVEEDYECWRVPEGHARYLPRFTGSIDDAVAFSEKVLPGYDYILERTNGGLTISCRMGTADPDKRVFADTLPLAIIDATLTALLETME